MKSICDLFVNYCQNQNKKISAYTLDKQEISNFKNLMARKIPFCYILKKEIKELEASGTSFKNIMNSKLPDKPNIMSGDFGELVSLFYLSGEMLKKIVKKGGKRKKSIHPVLKWHFKESRNRSMVYSDVIIICRDNLNSWTENDLMICAEAKCMATDGASPIEKSVLGAEKDRISRLADTIVWLKDKTTSDPRYMNFREYIERFDHTQDKELCIEYVREHIAISIIDEAFLQQELQKDIEEVEGIKIIVLGIEDVKNMYEEVFNTAKRR